MRKQNKRYLYESIMRDVAKVVKRKLNEEDDLVDIILSNWDVKNRFMKNMVKVEK